VWKGVFEDKQVRLNLLVADILLDLVKPEVVEQLRQGFYSL
jgi:hypothetical protein